MIGTQPGWCHDFCRCYWRFYDCRGQLVATIADEAYAREGFWPRDIILATS
jgi:hypothetical protein